MGKETEKGTPAAGHKSITGVVRVSDNIPESKVKAIRQLRIEKATIAIFAQYNVMQTTKVDHLMIAAYDRAVKLIDFLDKKHDK